MKMAKKGARGKTIGAIRVLLGDGNVTHAKLSKR